MPIDPYRFVSPLTRRLIKTWIARERVTEIPWTPLGKPLAESTLAVISSGAVALKSQQPFDQEGERQNPWWGDPSFRVIPRDVTEADAGVYHLHIPTEYAERDLNCIFPVGRARELVEAGELGAVAPSHYSFMGYILKPKVLLEESVPQMIERMQAEAVDLALLVPV